LFHEALPRPNGPSGVATKTAPLLARAGANVFVAGSAVFEGGANLYGRNVAAIRETAERRFAGSGRIIAGHNAITTAGVAYVGVYGATNSQTESGARVGLLELLQPTRSRRNRDRLVALILGACSVRAGARGQNVRRFMT
jgi:hypothetical protein